MPLWVIREIIHDIDLSIKYNKDEVSAKDIAERVFIYAWYHRKYQFNYYLIDKKQLYRIIYNTVVKKLNK